MSGHVYYRFKSQKEFQRIMFEGIGISVWDLKREIIQESKMGKGSDFDFAVYNADTDEEYANDHAIIPRSSSVIARRLPPKRPGHGNAQQYVGANLTGTNNRTNPPLTAHVDWRGGGAISKDFRNRTDPPTSNLPTPTFTPVLTGGERDTEAESMAAMFAAQDQQWQKTQETMATATRVGRNMGFRDRGGGPHRLNKPRENGVANGSSGTQAPTLPAPTNNNAQQQQNIQSLPPQGYICYRCGQKGHWIQSCPTNDNPEFEGRPRIKRTTGIPKSFLQKVEDGKPIDGQNVMVTADGSFVIAKPDSASWKQHKSVVVKNLSAADIENQRPSDPDLVCPICLKLLKRSVKMICCSSSFCESCISNYLKSHSSVCPECETKVSFNASSNSSNNKAFVTDEERRKRSDEYIQEILKISQAAQLEQSASADQPSSTPDLDPKTDPNQDDPPKIKKEAESSDQKDAPVEPNKNPDLPPPPSQAAAHVEESQKPKENPKSLLDRIDLPPQLVPNGSSNQDHPHQARVASPNDVQTNSANDFTGPNELRPNGHATGGTNPGHMAVMMNGMMDYGGNEGYGGMQSGAMENGAMMGGMGMNMGMAMAMANGMGFGQNGLMMGGNLMNANGFGGGMGMEMGAGAGPEGMLGLRLNQVMAMLQNAQLNEPMRIQLLIQQQTLQQQLAMVQRMNGAGGPPGGLLDHGMMNGMGRTATMLLGHPGSNFGTSMAVGLHHPQQDFGQNHAFGSFGIPGLINTPLGFQQPHGHLPNPPLGPPPGQINHHHLNNQASMMINQFSLPPNNPGPAFQRPSPMGNNNGNNNNNNNNNNGNNHNANSHLNANQRRHHWTNPNHHPYSLVHNHHNAKRKRPEDLIELETGEKVPRYM